MCWSSKTLEKRIANEDIKVFKVGYERNAKLDSYYRWFLYDINRLYETAIHPERFEELYVITQGFHSYNRKKCSYFCKIKDNIILHKIKDIQINVRTKITGKIIDRYYGNIIDSIKIFECTIPKGAEYFENEDGEIVSNQIIIKKIIE